MFFGICLIEWVNMAHRTVEKKTTPPTYSRCVTPDCGALNVHQKNGEGPMNTFTGEKRCKVCEGQVIPMSEKDYLKAIEERKARV